MRRLRLRINLKEVVKPAKNKPFRPCLRPGKGDRCIQRKNVLLKKDLMASSVKYMVDENGEKTSVLVPLKTWEKMNENYAKLQHKLAVLTGIKQGLAEINEAQKSGRKLQTLKGFLRESSH